MEKKKQISKQNTEDNIKADAMALAQLIYDIYQDKKRTSPDNRDKKE